MEKTSGLVLDFYDDPEGGVLKDIFPTLDGVPGLIKEAHTLTPEERAGLPDEAYALILVNGDTELKKYATIDAGNTALSVEYFLKTGGKLPAEAQKVAAHNLCCACGWFGIEPPEVLEKIAAGDRAKRVAAGLVGAGVGAGSGYAAAAGEKLPPKARALFALGGGALGGAGSYLAAKAGQKARERRLSKQAAAVPESQKVVRGRGLGPGKGKGPFRGTGLGPGTGECVKKAEVSEPQKVAVSMDWVRRVVGRAAEKAPTKRVSEFIGHVGESTVPDPSLRARAKRQAAVAAALGPATKRVLQKSKELRSATEKALKKPKTKTSEAIPESQKVVVSRVPKVRKRQLEALKSRGIEGPTKTAAKPPKPKTVKHIAKMVTKVVKKPSHAAGPPALPRIRIAPVGIAGGALKKKTMGPVKLSMAKEAIFGGLRQLAKRRAERFLQQRVKPYIEKRLFSELETMAEELKKHPEKGEAAARVAKRTKELFKKSSITKEAIGVLPLAIGAMMAPGAAREAKGRLQATKGMGGMVMTPQQMQMRKMQMGIR